MRTLIVGPARVTNMAERYKRELHTAAEGDAALRGCTFDVAFDDAPFVWSDSFDDVEHLVLLNRSFADNTLAAAPRLKLIQKVGRFRLGFDRRTATARGVRVAWLTDPSYRAVAEHTILLILAAARSLVELDAATRQGERALGLRIRTSQNLRRTNWMDLSGQSFRPLDGSKVGLIGLGEIGSEVARRALAFGMTILYTTRTRLDPDVEADLGLEYRQLDDLLRESDFVSLHVTHRATEPLLGARELALLRPTAVLVNTSRGNVIDQDALFERLRSGAVAAAGLDVFTMEPINADEIAGVPNLTLSPHVAAESPGSRFEVVLANLSAYRAGQPLAGELRD